MDRKHFLQLSSSAAAGLAFSSCFGGKKSAGGGTIKNLGIQLYSLRDDLPKDPKGILKKVASFGYKEIESYEGADGMFWGMKNTDFKKYMTDLGMTIVSSHCDHTKDFERKAAEAGEIGMKYLICPWLGKQRNLDDYKKAADSFNKAGAICQKNGLRFAYHNHDYSFRLQNGQFPQDIMMKNSDPALVDFEMDMYWVVTAGEDPAKWMEKYRWRFKLCHVKDRKKDTPFKEGEENQSCIVGKGSIDYKTILSQAKKLGMQHYILEQEAYEKAPLECVKEGAAYLNQLVF
ncbi:sugar phosphate isomerase/epimerase family protein [Niabella ginsengisoli]|uniref:Sugar phosphate isomerase/epimerase n=1 Tax=Niabella ginsengisoli TaxID=522298 RepID=A0ABS9SLN8_9BACT|nr:sugar phosphate isomerase/epimerase [Niabella ginsengisoli]MCH5599296.1 sugar phosphate isomerase/epimerase [Niabella ginsengisoli]